MICLQFSEALKERESELNHLKEAHRSQIQQQHREMDSLKQQFEGQLVSVQDELAIKKKEVVVLQNELEAKKDEGRQLHLQLNKSQSLSQQLMEERCSYQQRMEQMSK